MDENKNQSVVGFLESLGYNYNSEAQDKIRECDEWYDNSEEAFHKRTNLNNKTYTMSSLNFAKRCCADDANLCEIVEINAGQDDDKFEGVRTILRKNRFDAMYRKQLEKLSASGTVGAYVRLDNAELLTSGKVKGGQIRINYVDAESIVPLTVINDDVVECAFIGSDLLHGHDHKTLVIFRLDDQRRYVAQTFFFDGHQHEIPERRTEIQLGDVKPFSILRTAEVNNLDDMEGYGYPKLYSAIPILKCLDLCYAILFGDLDKGQKLIFLNEVLAEVQKDQNGKPYLTEKQKELFVLLGNEKLPEQKDVIQEYNPEIRTPAIKEAFELCLSILSMTFGYGTKKYSFESGQIKTATEYAGERQDSMQELNKQRFETTNYITELVSAIIWFSNTFLGTSWNINEEICIQYDDSYVTDKQTQMDGMRADALSFPEVPEFLVQYIMLRLNCERDEAIKYIQQTEPEEPEDTSGDLNEPPGSEEDPEDDPDPEGNNLEE